MASLSKTLDFVTPNLMEWSGSKINIIDLSYHNPDTNSNFSIVRLKWILVGEDEITSLTHFFT